MNTTEYLNSPIKNCMTCAHSPENQTGESFRYCRLFQVYCAVAVKFNCGDETGLKHWKPRPPEPPPPKRRSLRQWLYDTLLA